MDFCKYEGKRQCNENIIADENWWFYQLAVSTVGEGVGRVLLGRKSKVISIFWAWGCGYKNALYKNELSMCKLLKKKTSNTLNWLLCTWILLNGK